MIKESCHDELPLPDQWAAQSISAENRDSTPSRASCLHMINRIPGLKAKVVQRNVSSQRVRLPACCILSRSSGRGVLQSQVEDSGKDNSFAAPFAPIDHPEACGRVANHNDLPHGELNSRYQNASDGLMPGKNDLPH